MLHNFIVLGQHTRVQFLVVALPAVAKYARQKPSTLAYVPISQAYSTYVGFGAFPQFARGVSINSRVVISSIGISILRRACRRPTVNAKGDHNHTQFDRGEGGPSHARILDVNNTLSPGIFQAITYNTKEPLRLNKDFFAY